MGASVVSGGLTGLIDAFFVGKWDFKSAKESGKSQIEEQVISFAERHPKYTEFLNKKISGANENRLNIAVEFLEKECKLPGDSAWNFEGSGISSKSHHLDDLCHHPTIVGLICCIIVQFSKETIYSDSNGNSLNLPITVND